MGNRPDPMMPDALKAIADDVGLAVPREPCRFLDMSPKLDQAYRWSLAGKWLRQEPTPKQVEANLKAIRKRARQLSAALDDAPPGFKIRGPDNYGIGAFRNMLRQIEEEAKDDKYLSSAEARGDLKDSFATQKAYFLRQIVVLYRDTSGKYPTTTSRIDHTRTGGPFVDWAQAICDHYGIEASADYIKTIIREAKARG